MIYLISPLTFKEILGRNFLKKIRKWEKLQPEDYQGWWPISHEEVSTWVSNLAKLPPTLEGKFIICENDKNILFYEIYITMFALTMVYTLS